MPRPPGGQPTPGQARPADGAAGRRAWDSVGLVLLTAYTVVFVAWELLAPMRDPVANIVANAGGLVPGVGAIWLSWRTASSPRLPPRGRLSWRWLTASFLLFWLGDVVFLLLKMALAGGIVGASVADMLYLGSYPFALVALLTLPRRKPGRDERAAFWLDAAMVALGGGMVAWHVFIQPTLSNPGWDWEGFAVLVYVVADVTLLAALAISRLGLPRPFTWAFAMLGAGLGVRFLANALYWYDVRLGDPGAAGTAAAALYNLAWLAFAISAHARVKAPARPALPGSEPPAFSVLPTLAAAIGYLVLASAVARILTVDVGVVLFVGVGLTAAVLARQLVAVRAGARLAAERVSRQSEARFRSLVQNASDIVLVIGDDGAIRYHTPSAERFVERRSERLDGEPLSELVHPDDRAVAASLVKDALAHPGATPAAEWRLRWADGTWHFVEAWAKSVPDDPHLGGVILTLRSVHERKTLEARLAHQAFHDPLTRLANRVLFTDRLEQALARSRRAKRPVAVLFVDLDEFKNVNDSFGHATGDQLLVDLSRRLLACVRAGDTAARLGGDEFAVLLEDGGGLEQAREVARRVSEAVRAPFLVAGRELVLGASLGIATSETGTESAGDLLRNADVAMYRAKHAGKGQVVVFEAEMQTAVRERLLLEAELRGAVERAELTLLFQPIVSFATGRTLGAEALLRWDHPSRGRLLPGDFFPAAETAGVMPALEKWVVGEACRLAAGWPAAAGSEGLFVTVNVSPRQLAEPGFADHVERQAALAGLPLARLVIELTEGAAVENASATFAAMRRLRGLGVRLAIDDFGTGYSSLSYLRDMPFDVLKLDKVFVDGIVEAGEARLLTRGILDLGRALGKLVIAEGVERQEQAERLREHGCTLGQGFLFARPLADADLRSALAGEPARE
jgi:diguanylate cyclase (GGDEF)-like protein/PAS domain S-box-containing protein